MAFAHSLNSNLVVNSSEVDLILEDFNKLWRKSIPFLISEFLDGSITACKFITRIKMRIEDDVIELNNFCHNLDNKIIHTQNEKLILYILKIVNKNEFIDLLETNEIRMHFAYPMHDLCENIKRARAGDAISLAHIAMNQCINNLDKIKLLTEAVSKNSKVGIIFLAGILMDEGHYAEAAKYYRKAYEDGSMIVLSELIQHFKNTGHIIFAWHYIFARTGADKKWGPVLARAEDEYNGLTLYYELVAKINELAKNNYYNFFDELAQEESWEKLELILTPENQQIVLKRWHEFYEVINNNLTQAIEPQPLKEIIQSYCYSKTFIQSVSLFKGQKINEIKEEKLNEEKLSLYETQIKPTLDAYLQIRSKPITDIINEVLAGSQESILQYMLRLRDFYPKENKILIEYINKYFTENLNSLDENQILFMHITCNKVKIPEPNFLLDFLIINSYEDSINQFYTWKEQNNQIKPISKTRLDLAREEKTGYGYYVLFLESKEIEYLNKSLEKGCVFAHEHFGFRDLQSGEFSKALPNLLQAIKKGSHKAFTLLINSIKQNPFAYFNLKKVVAMHRNAQRTQKGCFKYINPVSLYEAKMAKLKIELGYTPSLEKVFSRGSKIIKITYEGAANIYFCKMLNDQCFENQLLKNAFNELAITPFNNLFAELSANDDWNDIKKHLYDDNVTKVYERRQEYLRITAQIEEERSVQRNNF